MYSTVQYLWPSLIHSGVQYTWLAILAHSLPLGAATHPTLPEHPQLVPSLSPHERLLVYVHRLQSKVLTRILSASD